MRDAQLCPVVQGACHLCNGLLSALYRTAPRWHLKAFDCAAVDAREMDVFADLERVLGAIDKISNVDQESVDAIHSTLGLPRPPPIVGVVAFEGPLVQHIEFPLENRIVALKLEQLRQSQSQ